jgi:catechol 2,3-dioxygenase-like lactoylglutathione lyase family enzyme
MPRMIYNMETLLQVRDLNESLAFYVDLLGFKIHGKFPESAPTWAGLASGNARVMLSTFARVAEPALTGEIYMYPDDLDVAWERLKDAAPVVEEPVTREYGMREFSVRDPNGYLITFAQSTEPHDHDHPHDGEHDHAHDGEHDHTH